jgi:hypothetical protein
MTGNCGMDFYWIWNWGDIQQTFSREFNFGLYQYNLSPTLLHEVQTKFHIFSLKNGSSNERVRNIKYVSREDLQFLCEMF